MHHGMQTGLETKLLAHYCVVSISMILVAVELWCIDLGILAVVVDLDRPLCLLANYGLDANDL